MNDEKETDEKEIDEKEKVYTRITSLENFSKSVVMIATPAASKVSAIMRDCQKTFSIFCVL
jgi:hypothetical protein